MKKKTSWKFMDESSITFQSSVSGAGEFGLCGEFIWVCTYLHKVPIQNSPFAGELLLVELCKLYNDHDLQTQCYTNV